MCLVYHCSEFVFHLSVLRLPSKDLNLERVSKPHFGLCHGWTGSLMATLGFQLDCWLVRSGSAKQYFSVLESPTPRCLNH